MTSDSVNGRPQMDTVNMNIPKSSKTTLSITFRFIISSLNEGHRQPRSLHDYYAAAREKLWQLFVFRQSIFTSSKMTMPPAISINQYGDSRN